MAMLFLKLALQMRRDGGERERMLWYCLRTKGFNLFDASVLPRNPSCLYNPVPSCLYNPEPSCLYNPEPSILPLLH